MLSTRFANTLLQRVNKTSLTTIANVHHEKRGYGEREVVGWGSNSVPHYVDRIDYPFPSLRFKEIKGELIHLKEKEKDDWKKLSLEEKKKIYRASFCQTFSEFQAPTGEWKFVLGWTLVTVAASIWTFLLMKKYASPPLPDSFSEENRAAQLRRSLDLMQNPITGISSAWDYEKEQWKK